MNRWPRITFGMIVLNGEPFIRYNLRALYPFAHQIIVVEGAAPAAANIATGDGHSSDGTLAATWTGYLDLGRSFTSFSLAFDERLKALTTAEVNAALRRHLDPAKMTVVIAGDAAKGAK